jgi:hypothetical protein
MSTAEKAGLAKEYAQMGFLAETTTPIDTILTDFYASFPAAFYTPGTDRLTIISQSEYSDRQVEFIIAHELTHAIQDQNLTMNPAIFPGYSSYNSDASLAQESLIEGDAMVTSYAYLFKQAYYPQTIAFYDSAAVFTQDDKEGIIEATDTIDSPVYLTIKNLVPYDLGAQFVAEHYLTTHRWSTINDLYSISAAPRSTAEINLVASVPVVYFDFHSIQSMLVSQPGSIEFADDDNAGFAMLLALFYGDLDTDRVKRSLGWRGDRYTFVKRQGRAYGTLVWAMAFADGDHARYMFGKLAQKIGNRSLGAKTAKADSTADSAGVVSLYTFTSESAVTKLKLTGNQVWWLENTDTLTQPILAQLESQKSAPALAKTERASALPTSLSAAAKMRVLKGIMRHAFGCGGR